MLGKVGAALIQDSGARNHEHHALFADFRAGYRGTLPLSEFARDKTLVKRVFFYDDEDGHASFAHMLTRYRQVPDTVVDESNRSFVVITSKNRRNRRQVVQYLNRPASPEGQMAIERRMAERGERAPFVVHRGHSYHAEKTLAKLDESARLVFLGSCGGFHNTETVLRASPAAQVIATKGEGTMVVNDALLAMIDGEFLRGQDEIEWKEFWTRSGQAIHDRRFDEYVSPADDLISDFARAAIAEEQERLRAYRDRGSATTDPPNPE
jgi:hypothetical protein